METLFPIEEMKKYVILSASRMTDMPKYYPIDLIKAVVEKKAKGLDINMATFNYPVLMASDIITYDSDLVPV
jgi:tryptophanyl-tRNA synthetase